MTPFIGLIYQISMTFEHPLMSYCFECIVTVSGKRNVLRFFLQHLLEMKFSRKFFIRDKFAVLVCTILDPLS